MVQSEISIVWVKYPRPSLSKEPQRIVSKCFGLSRRSLENPPSPLVKIGMFWVTFLARCRYETFALHLELVLRIAGRVKKHPTNTTRERRPLPVHGGADQSRRRVFRTRGSRRILLKFYRCLEVGWRSWESNRIKRLLCLVPESKLRFTSNYGLKGYRPV